MGCIDLLLHFMFIEWDDTEMMLGNYIINWLKDLFEMLYYLQHHTILIYVRLSTVLFYS